MNDSITQNELTNNSFPPPEKNSQDLPNNITSIFNLDNLYEKSISILGFDLHFDDIIILVLILFLLQEEKKDYILIGILGLMFFDISIDKITSFEPIKNLFSNFT